MQIIIDIPKEIYDYIHNEHIAMKVCDSHKVTKAIANGTPLPKGHGRLVDADYLDVNTIMTDDYSGNQILDVILKEDLDSAETIVKADKEKI